jgi:hypothetical protein
VTTIIEPQRIGIFTDSRHNESRTLLTHQLPPPVRALARTQVVTSAASHTELSPPPRPKLQSAPQSAQESNDSSDTAHAHDDLRAAASAKGSVSPSRLLRHSETPTMVPNPWTMEISPRLKPTLWPRTQQVLWPVPRAFGPEPCFRAVTLEPGVPSGPRHLSTDVKPRPNGRYNQVLRKSANKPKVDSHRIQPRSKPRTASSTSTSEAASTGTTPSTSPRSARGSPRMLWPLPVAVVCNLDSVVRPASIASRRPKRTPLPLQGPGLVPTSARQQQQHSHLESGAAPPSTPFTPWQTGDEKRIEAGLLDETVITTGASAVLLPPLRDFESETKLDAGTAALT